MGENEYNSYLVTLFDRDGGGMQRIVVQSPCACCMQEFVDELGDLELDKPVVVDISALDHAMTRH